MADTTQTPVQNLWSRVDGPWAFIGLILAMVAVFDPSQFLPTLQFSGNALLHTAPFILFAVFAVAYLKASGAEALLAKAFEGPQIRMIIAAALLGGLSPFCSCEVIPFIAALLALGAPLSAVMAFWLASPLMDPAMFAITSGTLGWEFAVAKTISAILIGAMGGLLTMTFAKSAVFADPLRPRETPKSCCGSKSPFDDKPLWAFWKDTSRVETFRETFVENGIFLLKWLAIAYVFEALMVHYVPAEWIAGVLGGEGFQPIVLGALVGGPAYLNGYAAVPLISGLLEQGMAPGAAMSFVIAGGVSCIPAAIAVWALVKPRVFAAYIGFAFAGSLLAGLAWAAYV